HHAATGAALRPSQGVLGSAAEAGLCQITGASVAHPAPGDDGNHRAGILRSRNRLQDVLPHREELRALLDEPQRTKLDGGSNGAEALSNAFVHGLPPVCSLSLALSQREREKTHWGKLVVATLVAH